MSNRPAVMSANFTNAVFMPGLKVCRIVLEIPQERRKEFFDAFGYPDPANPTPVAIARLVSDVAEEAAPSGAEDAPQGKRSWADMSRSQRAAVKLNDKTFKAWLVDTYWTGKEEIGDYDGLLKRVLGITSKRELDVDGPKAVAFDQMLASFDYRDRV